LGNKNTKKKPAKPQLCLGGKKTGKTAIISQFLYDEYPPSYRETIEEMYR